MPRSINKLSDLKIRNATQPGYLGDGGGLYLQVSKTGTKSWVYRYSMLNRAREMGLGSLSTFSLKEARERARRYRQMTAEGVDPIDAKHSDQEQSRLTVARTITFGQCCENYIDAHSAGWKNEKHAAQWDSTLRTYGKRLWPLAVDVIDTGLVMRCLEPIWSTKTETASRLRGRIESVLAWATVRKFRTGDNPAAWRNHLDQLLPARNKVQKVKRRAALPYSKIADFMAHLRKCGGYGSRALELQILTATRPGEAAGAQWSEFDLDGASWTIPAERMKAEKEHRIPLSSAVLALLNALPHVGPNVFVGVRERPITTAASEKVLKTMHAADCGAGGVGYMDPKEKRPAVPHGFRSTFRDWAAECTTHPREVIEAAMAHRLKDASEAAYQRGDLLRRRALLMKDWAEFCGELNRSASSQPGSQ